MGQARLDLIFTQKGLTEISKQMKELQKISKNLKVGNQQEMAKTVASSKKIADDQKLRLQRLDIENKLIIAQNKGMDAAVGYAGKLLELNKAGLLATQEELKLLRNMGSLEDQSNKLAKEKYVINKGITAEKVRENKEMDKLYKLESKNLYEISNLRTKINSSELSEKKSLNEMLDSLKKRALEDNFQRELKNVRALYDAELKNTLSLSQLNAKKNRDYLTSSLSGKSAQSSASAFGNLGTDRNKLELELQKSITNEWSKSSQIIQGYLKANQQGYVIKEQMWRILKKINAEEQTSNKILNEEVSIKKKLQLYDEKKAAKIQQQKDITAETLKQQQQMLSMASIGKTGSHYDKLNAQISKYQGKVRAGIKLTNDEVRSLRLLQAQTTRTATGMAGLANTYVTIAGMRKVLDGLKKQVDYVRELDQAVYDLGVVSKKSSSEIEDLKYQLLDMGSEFPFAAQDIASAMDIIGRTGVSFDDNLASIDDAMKLAISSGGKLSDVASLTAKNMVAFGLSSDQVSNSLNMMHSVVLSSPLTLKGLDDSAKNAASSFAILLEFTGKTGGELERYREQLLALDLAMTGGFAKLGEYSHAQYKSHELLETPKVA